MMIHNKLRIYHLPLLVTLLLFTACSANSPTPVQTGALPRTSGAPTGVLTPFQTSSATSTITPTNPATPTQLPSPTPTPRSHTVAQGEDMFGIAWRYRVTLEELMAANPDVNPNFLSIGTMLTIPPPTLPTLSSEEITQQLVTPTPMPVEKGSLECTLAREGGVWCFLPISNPHDVPLENLSGIFRLVESDTLASVEMPAFLPLDLLPPGATLPLTAYFTDPVNAPFQASAEVLTALPNPVDDGRYLSTRLENQNVLIAADGQSALVTAEVSLIGEEMQAQRISAAAVAYDANGKITGVRRWENTEGQSLSSGETLGVEMQVFSLSGEIARVEIFAQARP